MPIRSTDGCASEFRVKSMCTAFEPPIFGIVADVAFRDSKLCTIAVSLCNPPRRDRMDSAAASMHFHVDFRGTTDAADGRSRDPRDPFAGHSLRTPAGRPSWRSAAPPNSSGSAATHPQGAAPARPRWPIDVVKNRGVGGADLSGTTSSSRRGGSSRGIAAYLAERPD